MASSESLSCLEWSGWLVVLVGVICLETGLHPILMGLIVVSIFIGAGIIVWMSTQLLWRKYSRGQSYSFSGNALNNFIGCLIFGALFGSGFVVKVGDEELLCIVLGIFLQGIGVLSKARF